jgi:restriction system protein
MESTTWHYPPDFLEMMIDTTSLLVKSKTGLCSFFEGSGVPVAVLLPLRERIAKDRDSVRMTEIARVAIEAANKMQGDRGLETRREIVRRVAQFTAFNQCWPENEAKARGCVAQVREYVQMHTVATRYVEATERERQRTMEAERLRLKAEAERRAARQRIADQLAALFSEANAQYRGKRLESILNELFRIDGVLVTEAFELRSEAHGLVEQIDGVIEFESELYLVELKWWSQRLGPGDVSQHMLRVFARGQARGIFIANPGFTEAAIESVREHLHRAPFILAELEEIVRILHDDVSTRDWLRPKLRAAQAEKRPLRKYSP